MNQLIKFFRTANPPLKMQTMILKCIISIPNLTNLTKLSKVLTIMLKNASNSGVISGWCYQLIMPTCIDGFFEKNL